MSLSEAVAETPAGWIPVAAAALDMAEGAHSPPGVEIILLPLDGSPPLGLIGEGARVWRGLVGSAPVPPTRLAQDDLVVIHELERMGLVVRGTSHPATVNVLNSPILSSPSHELVYGLVAFVARQSGIRYAFVKGPALYRQGIRDHEHSGDVDVWCDPQRWDDLISALSAWGWRREPDPWRGTTVNHSATLVPEVWGCEIDVHRRIPGMTLDDDAAFATLLSDVVTEVLAGVPVTLPAPSSHAVIAALHAARPEVGRGPRSGDSIAAAADLLRRAPRTIDAVRRFGAAPALRAELAMYAPHERFAAADDEVPRDWAWRAAPTRAHAYLSALRELPPLTRARLLARLIWPRADVAIESARRAGHSTDDVLDARLHRLRRGVRAWLSSVRPHGRGRAGRAAGERGGGTPLGGVEH